MDNLNPQNFGEDVQFDSMSSNFSNQVLASTNNEGNNSALHFFLYLGNFFSLIFVASGLGAVLYQMINKMFPDEIDSYSGFFSDSAIRFGLASIIIATPIFFVLSYIINKYLFEGKILENSKVRKWTTYIVLFVAFAIFLGDLISLVYGWLDGDMATRFLLKVFVVLFISGSILGYYFWDMKRRNVAGKLFPENKFIGILYFIVILFVFISSFFVVDSPSLSRDKKSDAAIVSQMSSYTYSIDSYYSKKQSLPINLSELDLITPTKNFKEEISYRVTGVYTYQLCANFKTSNLVSDSNDMYGFNSKWKHDKGNKCFDGEISKYNRDSNIDKIQPQQNIPQPEPAYFQEQVQPTSSNPNNNQVNIK